LKVGEIYRRNVLLRQLVESHYTRNDLELRPGVFRLRGDTLEVFPAYEKNLVYRLAFFGDEIERILKLNPITGEILEELEQVEIYPAKHFITQEDRLRKALSDIEEELDEQLKVFKHDEKYLEAQRLEQRTRFDLEMMREIGYCSGIENYSRHMDQRPEGSAPWTLMDFMPSEYIMVIDESHMTVPQIRGMYNGDRSRKSTLVEYGFRLPSAMDNRPLTFDEFEGKMGSTIYTSATPGPYEMEHAEAVAEQIIRPTGLVDPQIEVRPVEGQVDDLIAEIRIRVERKERVLVTTLTKRMAEDLSTYLEELKIKVHYLHSEVETLDRVGILRDLRLGIYDVIVGINLLREGLDLPEVSLVAILDADKQGFLRSATALIQTIGRAARNSAGLVIMYGDKVTDAMRVAIDETDRRREKQEAYNREHHIQPATIIKEVYDITARLSEYAVAEKQGDYDAGETVSKLPVDEIRHLIKDTENRMRQAADALEFERAAALRDQIYELRLMLADESGQPAWKKAVIMSGEDEE
jgi:excinuclease ABC subunit B